MSSFSRKRSLSECSPNDAIEPPPSVRQRTSVDNNHCPAAFHPQRRVCSMMARLKYESLTAAAQHPVKETYKPLLHQALYQPDEVPWTVRHPQGEEALEAEIVPRPRLGRADKPSQVYAWIPHHVPISLDHHCHGWGQVHYAVVYPLDPHGPPHTFVAPLPKQAKYVAVKILNKAIVDAHIQQGNQEHPYREICRYQQLGDNHFVIKPLEVLQDDKHLFIITPLGIPFASLIYSRPHGLPLKQAHAYFDKLLRILAYLEQHDIHQRDVKPDNFVVLPNGELVLIDLAMSLKVPRSTSSSSFTHAFLKPTGNFGTAAFLAPEVFYQDTPFDGVAADLWSVILILYIMVTGKKLYHQPLKTDTAFMQYCVMGNGFETTAHPDLPACLRKLFAHTLNVHPAGRWTLTQVIDSDFVQNAPS